MTDYSDKTKEEFRLGKARLQKATLTGTGQTYLSVPPGYHSMVTINKNGSEVIFKATSDFDPNSDVDSAEFGLNLSEGTDDYQKGHNAGFTGFEFDVATYSADVEVIVLHYIPEK